MRTLVVSDLHLGARSAVDVLRRPAALEALTAALGGVDRLVLLGDVLELRHGPAREALAAARPVLGALGATLGAGAEVVIVPGNHDHAILAAWLRWRARDGPPGLRVDEPVGADATLLTRALAGQLAPARLTLSYPGVWLAPGVYATHGHYLDRHLTIPSFERLGAGALGRALHEPLSGAATPDSYERVLAPLYALLDGLAAGTSPNGRPQPAGASARAWRALSNGGPLGARLLARGFPLAVGALNRAGLGPLSPDLSGAALRRAGVGALGQVVARLGLDARWVLFGHTHRAGPFDGDDASEWIAPTGARLVNCGSWVYERTYLDRSWGGPYRPGNAIELGPDGEPRRLRLLEHVGAEALRPQEGQPLV